MVNVLIQTDTRYPVNRKVIRKAVLEIFAKHKLENLDAEVSVAVVGSRKMKELSQKYLGDDQKHPILTFALEEVNTKDAGFVNPPDGVLRLGDIVISWPQVLEAASHDGMLVDDEVYLLTCHGVDHLLGQHH